jgi:Flp pilus assembly protein TadG
MRQHHPQRRKSGSNRRGVAAVEFALVLPVFLIVSLGIIEYGRALMAANLVTNAAREGGRIAGQSGSTNTDVQNAVQSYLASALKLSSGQVTVNITITPAAGNPDPQNQCANAHLRDLIMVEAKIPYSAVALIPASFLKSVTLCGRSYMRHD